MENNVVFSLKHMPHQKWYSASQTWESVSLCCFMCPLKTISRCQTDDGILNHHFKLHMQCICTTPLRVLPHLTVLLCYCCLGWRGDIFKIFWARLTPIVIHLWAAYCLTDPHQEEISGPVCEHSPEQNMGMLYEWRLAMSMLVSTVRRDCGFIQVGEKKHEGGGKRAVMKGCKQRM